ncbi:MAG: hypothetical protein C4529_11865 [Deltaproteobacteria bacterium]|nr:MAG: hypothetical protein C4529_11865 [Deltaproteobacteria bacterium]
MANDYAPRDFLRQVQIALLREYFGRRKELGDIEWDKLKEAEIEPIHDAWHGLPDLARKEIESDFRRIHAMGGPDGTRAIIEEGQFHQLDLTPDLDAVEGHVNKAFWTFMNHGQVFNVAERLHRADHMNGRYWRKRKDIPKKQPDVRRQALEELANAVAAYYWEKQGRGSPCRAETYLRAGRNHYFFVYPKDYSDTFTGYDDDGKFERRPWNPAFEVVYIYYPEDSALDLYVQGDKNVVRDLQELFSRAILHEELGEETRNSVPYELNGLKRRDFSFPTEPADRVLEVRVSALKLSLVGSTKKRITFEATDSKASRDAVYELMETALHERRLPLSMVNVYSAVIKMVFENTNGHGRPTKVLTFRVSYPNSCNLKDSPEELVAKKCLKEWKIERQ